MQRREIEKVGSAPGFSTASAPAWQEQELLARMRDMARRGEIGQMGNLRHTRDAAGKRVVQIDYVRLAEPRGRTPYVVAGVTLGIGALYGIGVMLWDSRYIWLTLAAIAIVCWVAVKLLPLAGHASGCTGYHCSGCRR